MPKLACLIAACIVVVRSGNAIRQFGVTVAAAHTAVVGGRVVRIGCGCGRTYGLSAGSATAPWVFDVPCQPFASWVVWRRVTEQGWSCLLSRASARRPVAPESRNEHVWDRFARAKHRGRCIEH